MAELEARAGGWTGSRVRGGVCAQGAGWGGALGRAGGRGSWRSLVADPEAAPPRRGSVAGVESDQEP
jgi:hypothetical protein